MASFTWPAGIDITDGRIAPGEPITSDLMTDYRDRDDYIQGLFDNITGHSHTAAAGAAPKITGSLGIVPLSVTAAEIANNCLTRGKLSVGTIQVDCGPAGAGLTVQLNAALDAGAGYNFWPMLKYAGTGTVGNNTACHVFDQSYGGAALSGAGYAPRIALSAHNSAAGNTITVSSETTYITASRNEPIWYILRRKSDGFVPSVAFGSEPCGREPIIVNPDPLKYDLFCIELNRFSKLREHIKNNMLDDGDMLWPLRLALFWGIIEPDFDHALEPLSTEEEAPCLYAPGLKVIGCDFNEDDACLCPETWKERDYHDKWAAYMDSWINTMEPVQ